LYRFDDGSTLREHLKSKHTEGGIKCNSCEMRFHHKTDLKIHEARFHEGEWPYKCPHCGKGARHLAYLNEHIRATHNKGEGDQESAKDFILCEICSCEFPSHQALRRHKRKMHTEDRYSFICEDCGKVLTNPDSFRIHKRSHSGVKSNACYFCGTAFLKRDSLVAYLRKRETVGCAICQRRFTQRVPLLTDIWKDIKINS